MKKATIIISFAVTLLSCGVAKVKTASDTINNEKSGRLDSLYSQLYYYGEFNGNVLVAENGKIIYRKSFGTADIEKQSPLNENTLFNLASVSKQFTATAIFLLAKEGKLSLDDDISRFIPELSFYKGITISHLIHHTSGLPDYASIFEKKWDQSKIATNKDVVELFQRDTPKVVFAPNEKREYSNTGYLFLATIIERASNKPYNEFLKERIFKPLNMDRTAVLFVHKDNLRPENFAIAYEEDSTGNYTSNIPYARYLDGVYGQGRVYSTVNDLYKWDRALKNNTLVTQDDKNILFADSKLSSGKDINYGFGWFLEDDESYGKLVYHSGSWPGYLTFIERHLDNDRTIIILQSAANATGKRRLPVTETQKILYDQPLEQDFRLPEELLKKYEGVYVNEKGGESKIVFKHQSIWVQNGPGSVFELRPASETRFIVVGFRPEVSYTFILDENGEIEKCRLQQPEQGLDRTLMRKK